jgi:hypothetical protein
VRSHGGMNFENGTVRRKHARLAIARAPWLASDSPKAAQLEITRGHLFVLHSEELTRESLV